jgi:uncharacterized membrane protein (Fun14 family)
MKKFTIVFVGLCLLLQIFAPGLLFSVKIAHAGTLSTSMFPSSLAGLPLYQTSTQVDSPCYYDAEEFVVGVYIQQATVTSQLGVSLSKWSGSSKAESVARNCIDQVKQQFGATVTWTPVKDTTVSGYKSISTTATVPAEGLYMAVLYTIVQDHLVASALASTASVSVSTLKDVNATMVTKLPVQEPPEPEPEPEPKKKDDGQSCTYHHECKSGNCSNNICCQQGKDCCRVNSDCHWKGEFWKCQDYVCVEDKEGSAAQEQQEREAAERYRLGTDGVCEVGESCDTQDCMVTARCAIEEVCEWGGADMRAGVGCIAAIAADLNIVTQIADILQNVGCGIIVTFVSGLINQDIEKVTSALINIVYTAISIVKLKVGTVAKFIFNVIVCIDNYFGLSLWFLYELIPTVMGVISSVTQGATAAVGLGSPASLLVTDSSGRQIGIDENGNLHEDIAESFYIEFPKAGIKMVVLTDTKGKDFTVQTHGEASGEIDIKIIRSNKEGEIEKIEYDDISQDSGTKTELAFKSQFGAEVEDMLVRSAEGITRTEKADQVTKKTIEVPTEYKIGGFWRKLKNFASFRVFLFIALAFGIILILAGVYISFKKKS